jgi:hypothetical protein
LARSCTPRLAGRPAEALHRLLHVLQVHYLPFFFELNIIAFELLIWMRVWLSNHVHCVVVRFSASPALPKTEIATPTEEQSAIVPFDLMAAPKKKPSHARRRTRQHGQRILEERKHPLVQLRSVSLSLSPPFSSFPA